MCQGCFRLSLKAQQVPRGGILCARGEIPLTMTSLRALLHQLDSTPVLGMSPSPCRASQGRAPTCVVSPELVGAIFGSRGSLSQVIVVVRAIPAAQREGGESGIALPGSAQPAAPVQPCAITPRAVPGVADEHVRSRQLAVIPPHAPVLVQEQDIGPEAVGGEDRLVRVRLGRSMAGG